MSGGKDRFHKQARRALENAGWTVTHDPFTFRFGLRSLLRIDLGAEWRATALEAEQGQRLIAVEIKSFTLKSLSTDMYMAVGQYYCYHSWLQRTAPNRVLYLAVPDSAIDAVFAHQIGRVVQEDHGRIRLIGFDPETARVTRWVE